MLNIPPTIIYCSRWFIVGSILSALALLFVNCAAAQSNNASQLGFRAPDTQPPAAFSSSEQKKIKRDDKGTTESESSKSSEGNDGLVSSNLILRAKLSKDGQDVSDGLIWRIYSPIVGIDNKLPLIATAYGGNAHFTLQPGTYFVYAAFGHATVTKRVIIQKNRPSVETIVLDAGGLQMAATMPHGTINEKRLRFSIFKDDDENEQQSLILADVKPRVVVRLNAGTYHVVANYGTANAIMRSDIKVEAGKVTMATVQLHAAQITLKLVRQPGGEALADTSWSITNDSGDIVRETVGAYASLVLAEGDYVAIAKNKDQIYQKDFSVATGNDEDIEVIADQQSNEQADAPMD